MAPLLAAALLGGRGLLLPGVALTAFLADNPLPLHGPGLLLRGVACSRSAEIAFDTGSDGAATNSEVMCMWNLVLGMWSLVCGPWYVICGQIQIQNQNQDSDLYPY